ncbi:helix-turn-helix transcriptional regulator [Thermoactinomyces mirandus]|nr:helix-turn-helix transcriptional regulator [Thermoactinomyces mirandus]
MKRDLNKMKLIPRIKWVLLEREEEGNKMTQDQIAKSLDVKPQSVSSWVQGKTFPKVETLFKLAVLLNCKVDNLYKIEWEE